MVSTAYEGFHVRNKEEEDECRYTTEVFIDPPTGPGLVLLCLFFAGAAGCAPAGTPPVAPATPQPVLMPPPAASPEATLPSGWDTYVNQGQCGYAISHPSDMQGASQGTYSWILKSCNGGARWTVSELRLRVCDPGWLSGGGGRGL